ncbi:MAG: zinc-ribbon domain-containing protein [Polyangiales bacterium]
MNFLCDKCKQKYHVADEKVRGRAVTRFRCKKCENIIELRASSLDEVASPNPAATISAPPPADDAPPRPAPLSPPRPRPRVAPAAPPRARPRAPTTTGPAFNSSMLGARAQGAAAQRVPAPSPAPRPATPSTSAILNAAETGWYAGVRDLPVGPLTRSELIAKVQAGEVSPTPSSGARASTTGAPCATWPSSAT